MAHPELADPVENQLSEPTLCRKDTGEPKKLRRWSRGHQFIVRGGGHIDTLAASISVSNLLHLTSQLC